MVGTHSDQRTRVVAALAQFTDEWKLAQKRHVQAARQALAAAVREDLVARAALAAEVIAHVLYHAEHRHVHFLEHRDSAANVHQRYLLRRRDHNSAGQRDALGYRELGVPSARREIEHQAVELAPFDVEQELGLQLGHHRAAPDARRLIVAEQGHWDVTDAETLQRYDAALGGELDAMLRSDHHCDARTVNVGVHQADAPSRRPHREREVHCDGRLAHAAFAARHREDVTHTGHEPAMRSGGHFRSTGGLLHADVHRRHTGHRGDRLADVFRDLRDNLGICTRRVERYDYALVCDLDILDHAEGDDVAGEAGVLDFLELDQDFVRS